MTPNVSKFAYDVSPDGKKWTRTHMNDDKRGAVNAAKDAIALAPNVLFARVVQRDGRSGKYKTIASYEV